MDPSDQQLALKRWFKFQKSHKTLPPPYQINKDQIQAESVPFRIAVRQIDNIPRDPTKQLAIKFLFNLYYPAESCFFGRTYESDILKLDFLGDGKTIAFENPVLFFHLKVAQDAGVNMVIELVLFEKDNEVIVKRTNLGWCQFLATNVSDGALVKLNLKRGSSRLLTGKFQPQYETSQYYVYVQIEQSRWFENVKFLVPEACICGTGDEILGTLESVVPSFRQEPDLSLMPDQTIYVQNLMVQMPLLIEAELKNSVRKYREAKYKDENPDIDMQITGKRLAVSFHNGWTFTNTRGLQNYANLEEGKIVQQFIEGNSIDYRRMGFNGAIDVNRIFMLPEPKPTQVTGMLVIQLEYDASFLVTNLGRQNTRVCCGWFPLSVQSFNFEAGTSEFEEDLIVGPGKTLDGKIMVDLSDHTAPIVVSGVISFGKRDLVQFTKSIVVPDASQGKAPQAEAVEAQSKYFKGNEDRDKAKANLEEASKLESQIAQDNQRIKQLEVMLKQLQQERLVSQTQTTDDYERQLESLRQREQRYQDLLKEMQTKHDEELQRTFKQYEELKKMMSDLSSTQQQYMGRGQSSMANASLAILSDAQLYDQSELEKWRIIESMTSVPRKTFSRNKQSFAVEAQFGGKGVSRADMAVFASTGVKGLLEQTAKDTMENLELQAKSLEIELHDTKTASIVLVQFLAFRPKQALASQYSDDDFKPESLYSQEAAVPSRVVFTLNFFDFPLFTTEPLIYENGNDKKSLQQALRNDQPLLFIREAFIKQGTGYKEPVFKFELEPSLVNYPNIYKWFCHYLYEKCVTIEMWDSDSLQLFGTVKVPLRQLLRQQQTSASMLRSVDIVAPTFRKIMGSLQLMIKHVGKQALVQEIGEATVTKFGHSSSKRKVISKSSLDAKNILMNEMAPAFEGGDEGGETQQQFSQYDPNERIKERIRRFKVSRFTSNNVSQEDQVQNARTAQLNEIQRFKELKKGAFVKSVVQEHLSDEKVVHPLFGKTEIVPFEFRNEYKSAQTFQLIIDDPDYPITGTVEIGLIYQPAEWKYFVDHDNYPAPIEYNMVTVRSPPHSFSFFLNNDESVTFLLKIVFFRDSDMTYTTVQRSEEVLATRGKEYIKRFCYPRSLGVYITLSDTGQSIGGTKIRMFPHNNIIDHIYRFNERDNHRVKLTFPALYGYTVPSSEMRPILYSTDPNVAVEWSDDFQIRASLRVPEVRKQLDFNLLAYADSYFRELIANWQIHVNSLSGVSIEVPLGQVQSSKLTVHCEIPKSVRFYSSHPLTVWFPPPFDKNYMLTPGKINIININIRQFSEQIQRVLVNCVDTGSKELVYSWILNVAPTVPPISQVFDVKCPYDQPKHFIFPYYNKLSQENTLIFVSSHPDLLVLLESKYIFKAQERMDIRVRIQRKGELQQAEIKVFVGDEEKTKETYDCILFRVQFVQLFQ